MPQSHRPLWHRFPRSISVGSRELKIKFFQDESDDYGVYISEDDEIYFDSTMSVGRAVQVVLHELLHVIWEEGKFDDVDKDEEHMVAVLSCQIAGLFKQNPQLSEWIYTNSIKHEANAAVQ